MLHVTNGDAAADLLRRSGVPGEVLPWRDVLHEGPVPANLDLPELDAVRTAFLAKQGWGEAPLIEADFAERRRVLATARERDEVVLWTAWTAGGEVCICWGRPCCGAGIPRRKDSAPTRDPGKPGVASPVPGRVSFLQPDPPVHGRLQPAR